MVEKCPEVSKGLKEKIYLGDISPNVSSLSQLTDVGIGFLFYLESPTSAVIP